MNAETYNVPYIKDDISAGHISAPLTVKVPGSKSITNRALLICALANGESILKGAMLSGDSRVFIDCLRTLGITIETDSGSAGSSDLTGNVCLRITGCGGVLPHQASINVGSAGTAARFLTAVLGVSHGTYDLDSSMQMRKRPMSALLDTLTLLGCKITCHDEPGHFPFTVISDGFGQNDLTVDINDSSQFLSAMLVASVLSERDLTIRINGRHGMSYVDMTRAMMERFGVTAKPLPDNAGYAIPGGQSYLPRTYSIEPDASAAAYFYALTPLLGITICVEGIHFDSLQGDVRFIKVLTKMGCNARESEEGIILTPPADGRLCGICTDMSSFSDQAITLACIAPFCDSPTTISGIGHIRKQESDRLSGMATELARLGVRTDQTDDSITVYPAPDTLLPACIDTYNDHRMAMGFTLIGLRSPGITINDPGCCAKTFENYYEVLEDVIKRITAS